MAPPERSDSARPPFEHAVLLAASTDPASLGAITERTPAYLLPLAGKPLADRIAGSLADLGVRQLTVLVGEHAEHAADFFRTGARWGIEIQLVDIRSEAQAVARLQQLQPAEPLLIGTLSCWPNLDPDLLANMAAMGDAVLTTPSDKPVGWGAILPATLGASQATSPDSLFMQMRQKPGVDLIAPGPLLRCSSVSDILGATALLLNHRLPNQLIPGASGDPGLWIGAGSIIHPTVHIERPVWIGENCRLERGVRLGPNTSIAENCVVGELATLENTCVLSATCIGNQVELKDALVDRNYMAYLDATGVVAIPDAFLIAPNEPLPIGRQMSRLFGRLVALVLLVALFPLTLLLMLVGRLSGLPRLLERAEAIRLPAPTDPVLWKHFGTHRWAQGQPRLWNALARHRLLALLPALTDIAFGHLHWVGLAPRTTAQLQALPKDWRMLYLACRPGWFQLARIDQQRLGHASADQQYSSEAFYAATHSIAFDMRIILRALFQRKARSGGDPQTAILSACSGPEILDQLHRFLREQLAASAFRFPHSREEEIVTAVHEACTNILRHAYDDKPDQPIQLHLRAEPGQLVTELFDRGAAFDPTTVPPPEFSVDAEGGFGWFLIRELATSVEIGRTGNGWNQLTLLFSHNPEGDTQNGS